MPFLESGFSRNVEGIFADTIRKMNEIPGKKIALDMPSGISSDTGAVLNCAFRADCTITFAYEKIGMHLSREMNMSGRS